MDLGSTILLLQESLVLILVFLGLLTYAMVRGRQALVSLILGLYLALLISIKFPYYDFILNTSRTDRIDDTLLIIVIFVLFAVIGTFLFERLIADGLEESTFEGFHIKLLLALGGAALIMAFSYHVIPITTLIDPGTPVGTLFAPPENFFWWLIVPLIILLLV